MRDVTSANFGLLIAYLILGFFTLLGITQVTRIFDGWLLVSGSESPTVGGFFYGTLASIALGLTVSTIRWMCIDFIHHSTGVKQPVWDFGKLGNRVAAFDRLIDMHYRYYQWYGNSLVALGLSYALRLISNGFRLIEAILTLFVMLLFFMGSRDTLQKYYARVSALLGTYQVC